MGFVFRGGGGRGVVAAGGYRVDGGVVLGSGSRASRGTSGAVGICDIVVGILST